MLLPKIRLFRNFDYLNRISNWCCLWANPMKSRVSQSEIELEATIWNPAWALWKTNVSSFNNIGFLISHIQCLKFNNLAMDIFKHKIHKSVSISQNVRDWTDNCNKSIYIGFTFMVFLLVLSFDWSTNQNSWHENQADGSRQISN